MLYFICRKLDWAGLGAVFGHLDFRWAAAGSASTFTMIALLALRWRSFLNQQSIRLPYQTTLSLTWTGQFFNSILPGSTGGDVVKLIQICRLVPDRKAAAASTVLLDRLSALIALLALALGAIVVDPRPLALVAPNILLLAIGLVGVAGSVALWLVYRMRKRFAFQGRLGRMLEAARGSLVFNGQLLSAFALAFTIHLLNFFAIYLFARALGIPISYSQVLCMMPVVLFLIMIPVTINGHGLREVLLIAYFGYMRIAVAGYPVRETAVALSLLTVANDLLWSLPGGLWYLLRWQRTPLPSADQCSAVCSPAL